MKKWATILLFLNSTFLLINTFNLKKEKEESRHWFNESIVNQQKIERLALKLNECKNK